MELVLGLDAGTTGVRCVALDASARVVDAAYREFTQYFPEPGWVEHDPLEIVSSAVYVLREVASRALSQGHQIVCVGLTNQRETTVAFDRMNGHIAHHAIVWQDRRTQQRCADLRRDELEPLIRHTTGLMLDSYFSATKMQWLLERGVLDAATSPSLCTIDTWLLWSLSGGPEGGAYVSEPSNASRTMLMDLETLDWSNAMLDLFSIPSHALADIRPSSSTFARISPDVIPELAGVAITGVLGDQQAALFGQACFDEGVVKATYGTGAFILANAGEKNPGVYDGLVTSIAWDLGAFGPVTYCVEGSAFVAGAAVQWLRDELGFLAASSELEALATQVTTSDGVRFVPAFVGLGSPFWNSNARGSLTGLSFSTGRAHIARAVLESLAFQVRAITDAFQDAGIALRELRSDGGAAAMNSLMQLQATNSRLDVRRSTSLEATARGAATLAGLASGLWDSLDELRELWEYDAHFVPEDPTNVDLEYDAWLRACERS
jgi:glycerol kinase